MTISLGVLSISLLLLALVVNDSLATPLTVVGLIGLALLRLTATSGGWAQRRRITSSASRARQVREDTVDVNGGSHDDHA